jgi:putative phage-type endonuclease
MERNSDPDYGPNSQRPDMSTENFEKECQIFMEYLDTNKKNRNEIENRTIRQRESMEWVAMRRKMLTASNFGRVCKMLPHTGCENAVKSIIYSNFDSPHLEYGRVNEERARMELEAVENISIQPCGLFIDEEYPFLGATPDGIVGDHGIVEIKCPSSAAEMSVEEAIEKGKVSFWMKNNEMKINRKHNYFFQIQGQLHISKRDFCIFAVWTKGGLKVERIHRDEEFWKEFMEDKLKKFYLNCMLPELVDPRFSRSMPIRNPPYILAAQEKRSIASVKRKGGRIKGDKGNLECKRRKK